MDFTPSEGEIDTETDEDALNINFNADEDFVEEKRKVTQVVQREV
jgi:hypothetical protein